MEGWERVKLIMDKEGHNKNSFSAAIGLNNNVTITRIINEQRIPSRATCEKIVAAFPKYNIDWLLTGEGQMQKETAQNSGLEKGYITYLLPQSAMGGSLTGIPVDGVLLDNCERVISPIENVDFAITIYGESMYPEYPSGSRVLVKKIDPNSYIAWGNVYVLDTSNGVIIKEVQPSDKEGYIQCVSFNPNGKYKPFDVPKADIYGMYRVLACVSAK